MICYAVKNEDGAYWHGYGGYSPWATFIRQATFYHKAMAESIAAREEHEGTPCKVIKVEIEEVE